MNVHNSYKIIGKTDRILWFNTFFHSLLVSGSDDLNAILWDPLQCQKKCCIKTGHSGNIFSVKVSYFIVWLAPWVGKMNRISCCDWLPKRVRWSYLARSGYRLCPTRKIYHVLVLYPIRLSPLLTKLVQSRWLDIGLVVFFVCLWKKELGQYISLIRHFSV